MATETIERDILYAERPESSLETFRVLQSCNMAMA
jgi:hypothetical protein